MQPDSGRGPGSNLAVRQQAGVEPVLLPPRSPNLNAHLERIFLIVKSEALERMILFGEKSLRNAISSFLIHPANGKAIVRRICNILSVARREADYQGDDADHCSERKKGQ